MGSFLLVVVAAIVLSGIVFGAAAFTLGRDRGLTPPRPDGVPFDLPADRPLDRPDVEDVRFDTALRGYRMNQVDEIMRRVADDLDFLHARIIDLEDQLAARPADADEDEDPPFEFPWTEASEAAEPASTEAAATTPAGPRTEAAASAEAAGGAPTEVAEPHEAPAASASDDTAAPASPDDGSTGGSAVADSAAKAPGGSDGRATTDSAQHLPTNGSAKRVSTTDGPTPVDTEADAPGEAEVAGQRSGRGR